MSEKAHTVAKYVLQHPGVTAKDVAAATGISLGRVHVYLLRCEGLGWIRPTHRHNPRGHPSLVWSAA